MNYKKIFRDLLDNSKIIFFIDGLNELPQRETNIGSADSYRTQKDAASMKLTFDPREESLLVLARESKCKFVLSCRILEYTHLPGWREFRILPLNDYELKNFIENYLANKDLCLRLNEILNHQKDLFTVLNNPFYLRCLIRLVQENWEIDPVDKYQLVEYMCCAALNREAKKMQIDPEYVIRKIGKEAYDAMSKGWIGSWFTTHEKFSAERHNKKNIIPYNTVIKCCEGARIIIDVKKHKKYIVYRYLHQLTQEALAISYLKLNKFKKSEYSDVEALHSIGKIHLKWGKKKEAEENFLQALKYLKEIPYVKKGNIFADIHLDLSRLYRYWRQSTKGIKHAEIAVQWYDQLKEQNKLSEAYHELGLLNLRLKRKKESEKYYKLLIKNREKLGDQKELAYSIMYGIADFYSDPSVYKIPKSLNWYDKALDIFQNVKDESGIAHCKLNIGLAYRLHGDMQKAEQMINESLFYFESSKQKYDYIDTLHWLGITLRDSRQYSKAIPLIEKALTLASEYNYWSMYSSLLVYGLAWILSAQGNYHRSIEILNDEALPISKRLANPSYTYTVYWAFAYYHWRAKKIENAIDSWLLLDKTIDEEYRLHLAPIYRVAIYLSKKLGKNINSNLFTKLIGKVIWNIYNIVQHFNRPTHWIGRQMWKLFWWSHKY